MDTVRISSKFVLVIRRHDFSAMEISICYVCKYKTNVFITSVGIPEYHFPSLILNLNKPVTENSKCLLCPISVTVASVALVYVVI